MTISTVQKISKHLENSSELSDQILIEKTNLKDHPEILVFFALLVTIAIIFFCVTLTEEEELD